MLTVCQKLSQLSGLTNATLLEHICAITTAQENIFSYSGRRVTGSIKSAESIKGKASLKTKVKGKVG